ncbi:MAG: bifunctional prephenate dehydrogenase/3-phosphoshikimate 1-carboxyvinyltransferase [Gammaproteobacteria bacterium]|nr:bifunctional prephenate dehydrogenase/3-phosphoshikimate 1-carboxyvinyltransferase [Gammaproteobacteria bacterium]
MKPSRIAIVGLGLIGGSLARALKRADAGLRIGAVDLDEKAVRSALDEQAIDTAGGLSEVCSGADLVIVAAPPLAAPGILRELEKYTAQEAVITDVASAKGHLTEALAVMPASFRTRVVPGHPLAGSEQSGFAASKADLFLDRNVVLTPLEDTDSEAIAAVHDMWRMLGANVLAMSAARHDRILALTSHLPHLLAFAVADLLARREAGSDANRYAASGFADFTRLAASDPDLWADIFSANSSAAREALDALTEDLKLMRQALTENDRAALGKRLRRGRLARENFDLGRFRRDNEYKSHSRSESGLQTRSQKSFLVQPGGSIKGRIRVPGDKSISHRAVMLGSLAEGVANVSGFLEGEDALNTLAAFRELGVTIAGPENGCLRIYGVGLRGLQAPRKPLFMGNAGTAMRLLAGVLAGQRFASELHGDESLSSRPMDRIIKPLSSMGAHIAAEAGGRPPLRLNGAAAGGLQGIDYDMPVASAQVKSCLLFAGLYADGVTTVREPGPCRDHTERMLRGFGVRLEAGPVEGSVSIEGGQTLTAASIDIPGDVSSAAFFMVAAAITPGSALTLKHVGVNPTRTGIIEILRQMGADIRLRNERESGGEPVADIEVRYRPLHGVDIGAEQVALAIDEIPALLVAAACAEGETRVRGAGELRVKESDRIDAMAQGLSVLGIENETWPDGIRVVGGEPGGGVIESHGDHRIAMAFAVAGLRCREAVTIRNCANVATSFPGFAALARKAGLDIAETDLIP